MSVPTRIHISKELIEDSFYTRNALRLFWENDVEQLMQDLDTRMHIWDAPSDPDLYLPEGI